MCLVFLRRKEIKAQESTLGNHKRWNKMVLKKRKKEKGFCVILIAFNSSLSKAEKGHILIICKVFMRMYLHMHVENYILPEVHVGSIPNVYGIQWLVTQYLYFSFLAKHPIFVL